MHSLFGVAVAVPIVWLVRAPVAQWIERRSPEPKAVGSIPIRRTITRKRRIVRDLERQSSDSQYMALALTEARLAFDRGEIPVGAVVVIDECVVAQAGNTVEAEGDPRAHAELRAVAIAGEKLGWRAFSRATLYTTVEPCPMCAGMLVQLGFGRVVYGTESPLSGCAGTVVNLLDYPGMQQHVLVTGGVERDKCQALVGSFFSSIRTCKTP